jgi:hypothetical protein
MEASVSQNRIDILGAELPKEKWESLLNELKAEHVRGHTPFGKRMSVVVGPSGHIHALIYRTTTMPDKEVIRILGKYGILATMVPEVV